MSGDVMARLLPQLGVGIEGERNGYAAAARARRPSALNVLPTMLPLEIRWNLNPGVARYFFSISATSGAK